MANLYRNLIYSTSEYTKSYRDFTGVELNGSAITDSPTRLALSENMYKDYDADGADVLESVPGYRVILSLGERVHAIYYQRCSESGDCVLIHSADKLRRIPVSDISEPSVAIPDPIATLCDSPSCGFEFGGRFYVMDGKKMVSVDETGECRTVTAEGESVYVPTTYVSGQRYEERNMLTDRFREEMLVSDPSVYYYSSDGLKYHVTDSIQRYCSLSSVGTAEGEVYVPSVVTISGIEYKVTEISMMAFNGSTVTGVYISDGIKSIGARAFYGCKSLTTAVLPSSLETIGERAFAECTALTTVYIGSGLRSFGSYCFTGCTSLERIRYALYEEELSAIENTSEISGFTITYAARYTRVKIALPLHDRTLAVSSVQVNGEASEYETVTKDEYVECVVLNFETKEDATNLRVSVDGTLAPAFPDLLTRGKEEISGFEAVMGCTLAEVFDGRIFLSGNPRLPNTVFYTETGAFASSGQTYVGWYSYVNDGVGGWGVKAMLAVRDMLAVFKEGDDGTGSIFYHKREYTTGDSVFTVYPVAYVHSGISAKGEAISFLDDPVFLTGDGLFALESENISYQRSVACRSHNVSFSLLKEDLSKARLCVWQGYLVVGVNGKIYLADSRAVFTHPTGSREYEWFVLKDIGAYIGDRALYVYSDEAMGEAIVHPTKSGKAAQTDGIYSALDTDGNEYYYTSEDGVKYRVIPTEERTGGSFCPATTFMAHGKHLFFATEAGHVCVFNNDKRGVAPEHIRSQDGFSEAEYAARMGNKIHPYYYDFAGHRARYAISTALDDCGIPHLTKSTVKKSLIVKAKSYRAQSILCEVSTDRRDPVEVARFPAVGEEFDNLSFEGAPWSVERYTSVALPEKEKRWVEKQIKLSADEFRSPISVWSITYRYTIKGKIKNDA